MSGYRPRQYNACGIQQSPVTGGAAYKGKGILCFLLDGLFVFKLTANMLGSVFSSGFFWRGRVCGVGECTIGRLGAKCISSLIAKTRLRSCTSTTTTSGAPERSLRRCAALLRS
ncbi:hypothetical protein L873DRAFT_1870504 [Choiromyces venosus 120613-1]|uniref:Uncharacterized protein n=1 Tax=Choiromyces venosus 120613-1 TaxID=1336337 RepID=A0A3N4JWZ5_9PEZI|nr:hypothetical protein L873DRAFT_1870504 [Choiromyces venosus 120613-1]